MGFICESKAQITTQSDYFSHFEHFSSIDGLNSNMVLDIIQDKYGYVWVATSNGLNRFDGYSFKVFYTQIYNTSSISDNFITCLEIDKEGDLWIGTKNGLNKYNYEDQSFERHESYIDSNTISNNYVRALLADGNNLWVDTRDGVLNKLDLKLQEFNYFHHEKITQGFYNYHDIYKDRQGNIWIGGRNLGPLWFDPINNKFNTIESSYGIEIPGKKRETDAACYFEDSFGNFWISATDGIYKYDRTKDYFDKFYNASTYDIVEDNKHAVWFGTGRGLLKFDQKEKKLTLYKNLENNNHSLVNDHINKLFVDRTGNLWIGTNEGLSKLSYFQNRFKHIYYIPGLEQSLSSNKITSLFEDRKQNIWVGTQNNGLSIYEPGNNSFTHFNKNSSTMPLLSDNISCFEQDKNNNMYIGSWEGIGFEMINLEKNKRKKYSLDPSSKKRDWYNDFLIDSKNNFWLAVWGGSGLYRLHPEKDMIEDMAFSIGNTPYNTRLNKLLIIRDKIFLGSNNSFLYHYELSSKEFYVYLYEGFKAPNSENYIHTTLKNYRGIAKLETDSSAVFFSSGKMLVGLDETSKIVLKKEFSSPILDFNYLKKEQTLFVITKNSIYNIHLKTNTTVELSDNIEKHEKTFVFGNDLWLLSNKNELILHEIKKDKHFHKEKILVPGQNVNDFLVLENNDKLVATDIGLLIRSEGRSFRNLMSESNQNININKLFKLNKDTIVLGSSNGVYILNTNGFNIKPLTDKFLKDFLSERVIYDIAYKNSVLWFATDEGMRNFNLKTQTYDSYNYPGNHQLSSRLLTCLEEDEKNNLWIGTSNKGVSVLDLSKNTFKHYYKHNSPSSLPSNEIKCIYKDSRNNIWIGSRGLSLYKPATDDFITYTTNDGLISNEIMSIIEDNNKNIWIATINGMSCFNLETNSVQNYYLSDGIKSNEYTPAGIKLKNGNLCFGGKNGLTIFNPDQLVLNTKQPVTYITDFKVFNKPVVQDLSTNPSIVLSFQENFFSIEFSSLDFSSTKNNKYKYKLHGVDQDWIHIEGENKVNYTKIAPGKYVFEVFGTNNDGIWSKTSAKINITTKPPFYTNRFILIAFFLIVTLIAYFLIRMTNLRYKYFNAKLQIEQKLLRSQMNPHFIFNSLIAIQSIILKGDAIKANRYLSNFSKLMRLNLDSLSEENISLSKELEIIKYYCSLQQLRFDDSFKLNIVIDEQIKPETFLIPPMFIQPFIENSLEHGLKNKSNDGLIELKIQLNKKQIKIEILDNGIGIHFTKQENIESHKSRATAIVQERLEQYNKLYRIKSDFDISNVYDLQGNSLGTKVSFNIPYKIKNSLKSF